MGLCDLGRIKLFPDTSLVKWRHMGLIGGPHYKSNIKGPECQVHSYLLSILILFISVQCIVTSHTEIDEKILSFYFLVLLVLSLRSWYFLCRWLIVSFEKCAKSSLPYSVLLKMQLLLSHIIFYGNGPSKCIYSICVSVIWISVNICGSLSSFSLHNIGGD